MVSFKTFAFVLGVALFGCGDEQSKLDRGIPVGEEQAVPGSAREFEMTEEQRQHQIDAQEAKKEAEEFDRANE